jgi:L-fucose isomerase-like protein
MRAGIFYIFSDLHEQIKIKKMQNDFFSLVSPLFKVEEVQKYDFSCCDLVIISVLTGGTENQFIEIWPDLQNSGRPFILVAFNSDNSLPATLEIKTWLNEHNIAAPIVHGDLESIAQKLALQVEIHQTKAAIARETAGVIGDPSDWLIASNPDYRELEKKLGIRFNFIPMTEFKNLLNNLKETESADFSKAFARFFEGKDPIEYKKAEKIYLALEKALHNYCLTSLTIRCFDILESEATTGCLALSLLNDKGIVAGCEGDVPTLVSMIIARHATKKPVFMANPSRLSENEIVLAHCTAPCSMLEDFTIDTHFESDTGLAVSGLLPQGPVTLFKIDPRAESYVLSEGKIVQFEHEKNLCRTQVKAIFEGIEDRLLKKPLGNHQVLIQGHYGQKIKELCDLLKIKPAW